MGTRATTILVAGLVLALARTCPVQAQNDAPRPAVLDSPSKPIGKVVAADGSVIIEHAGAAIVQANVAGEAIQTKIGDPVYLGDVVRTGVDGRVGINFVDGTSFNLSSDARMTLDEYVYDPAGKSNSTIFNLDSGDVRFCCRPGCEDRRHEDRNAGRHDGRSRHHTSHRNLRRRNRQVLHSHRRGQEQIYEEVRRSGGAQSRAKGRAQAQSKHLPGC